MRVFVALELPDAFIDQAANVARSLTEHVPGRFMTRDSYHITLAFIGEVPQSEVGTICNALDTACFGQTAVPVRADGLGKFGRAHDATLWLGLKADPLLMQLAERVREELAASDIAFDAKPFKPHLTLARRARIPKSPLPDLAFPEPCTATAVTLFKSTLAKDGAVYKPLYTVELPETAFSGAELPGATPSAAELPETFAF